MKEADAILYLSPRTNHGRNPQKDCEQDQQQTQTVHSQMKAYAQLGDPGPI
jgi:hypothetical protein